MKRTYQPSKKVKAKKCGFLRRMKSECGKKVIKRRRAKGRKRLAI